MYQHRSPYESSLEMKIWRFFGLFDTETDSELKRKLFRAYVWFYQIVFCYIGFLIQLGALFYVQSAQDAAETLYVTVSYGNAVIKILLTFRQQDNVTRLYNRMNIEKYRANGGDELRYCKSETNASKWVSIYSCPTDT